MMVFNSYIFSLLWSPEYNLASLVYAVKHMFYLSSHSFVTNTVSFSELFSSYQSIEGFLKQEKIAESCKRKRCNTFTVKLQTNVECSVYFENCLQTMDQIYFSIGHSFLKHYLCILWTDHTSEMGHRVLFKLTRHYRYSLFLGCFILTVSCYS